MDRKSAPRPGPARADAVGRRQRLDGMATRKAIRDAALRLFHEHGFANTSVRAVARAARANLASVYYHFGSKARLYDAAVSENLAAGVQPFGTFDEPSISLAQALAAYFRDSLAQVWETEQVRLALSLRMHERPATPACGPVPPAQASVQQRWLAVLRRHFPRRGNERLVLLAAALAAMGTGLAAHLPPGAIDRDKALRAWPARLSACALALIDAG